MKKIIHKSLNHSKTRLKYHIIFSTKYRYNILEPIREDLFNLLELASKQNNNFKIEIMEIDKNHIHFLIQSKPSESISNIVKQLKQYSTYYIWKKHYDYMRQFYWKQHHLWTRGYFATTIGECSDEKIKEYIKKQG